MNSIVHVLLRVSLMYRLGNESVGQKARTTSPLQVITKWLPKVFIPIDSSLPAKQKSWRSLSLPTLGADRLVNVFVEIQHAYS